MEDTALDLESFPLHTVFVKDDSGNWIMDFSEEQAPICAIWTDAEFSRFQTPLLEYCCDLCQSLSRACQKSFSLDEDEELTVTWRLPNICEIWVGRAENQVIRVFASKSE